MLVSPAWAAGVPTKVSRPMILGTPQAGRTLIEVHGWWTNQPTAYAYRWTRCNTAGNSCDVIAGATAQTYTLTAADVGHTIVVREIASNAAGSSDAERSAPTAVVSSVQSPSPTPTPAPPTHTLTPTTTSLAPVVAPVVDQAVTLVAAVTASNSASRPSGWVTFKNGGSAISGCASVPVAPTGQSVLVSCQTWFAASAAQLTAEFHPTDATTQGSASPTVPLTIGPGATSTSLDVPKTAGVGASTTYTVMVNRTPGGIGTLAPTGAVQFFDSGQPIGSCGSQPLTSAGATCTVTYNAPGSHSISAQYGGDNNFSGSSAPAQTVTIVKPSRRVRGLLGATMQWTFDSTLTYTKVLTLVVNGASGATVTTSCRHQGCPFTRRATAAPASAQCRQKSTRACSARGAVNLAPGFRNRRLSVGAQITVAITRAGWIGRYYQFTMRARRPPRIRISCLAPGATRPGRGC
ncbi:MAG: Ig-like domain repeat protein [Solirubrobacteraceae bacterium]